MTMFDGYVAVDWSANGTPKTGWDSIWIAVYGTNRIRALVNPNTRRAAMDYIETLLNEATADGHRLLLGFDFTFGYPVGTAQILTGLDGWEAVWRRIAEVITDGPRNANNRFDAAAELNGAFQGAGPFWGNGLARDIIDLPRLSPWPGRNVNPPPRRRCTEMRAPAAHEVWQLNGAGSVGGQALTGIAMLQGLRCGRDDVQVWPFETLGEERSHVLAEIYPSLIDPCPGNEVLDARQVKAVAEAIRELDRTRQLAGYLNAPINMPDHVRTEEALFLGVHAQAAFQAVAQETPCRGAGAAPHGNYHLQYIEEDARSAFQLAVPPYVPLDQQPVFQELQRHLGPDLVDSQSRDVRYGDSRRAVVEL